MKNHDVLLLIEPWPAERFRGIARFAKAAGWHVMMEDPRNPPPVWNGDGALVMMNDDNPALTALVRKLRRQGRPVVDLICAQPRIRLPRVIGDHRQIGRLAAEHFAERHYTRLAWFSAAWSYVHQQRFAGFAKAAGSSPLRWVWTKHCPPQGEHDWRRLSKWLGDQLARAPKPIGVLAYADYDATLLLNTCLERGLAVPEEVAILGVDNYALLCENQPVPISSVFHDHEAVGYEAAALLEELMNGTVRGTPCRLVPPRGVVLRTSTDAVAAADPLVRQALVHIGNNLDHAFGLAQASEACQVRPVVLAAAFNRAFGHSVGDEILRQRLVRAKRLFRETSLTSSEVARRTGFCNAAYLSNVFKRETGQTPRAFRRQA